MTTLINIAVAVACTWFTGETAPVKHVRPCANQQQCVDVWEFKKRYRVCGVLVPQTRPEPWSPAPQSWSSP